MAFADYSELKTAVTNRLGRTDLATRMDEFLLLAEQRIYYGSEQVNAIPASQPLRWDGMQTTGDVSVNAERVSVPADFLEARNFYLDTNPRTTLTQLPTTQFHSRIATTVSGTPEMFTVEGSEFVFAPTPSTTFAGKLLYYKRFATMSADTDTNTLLTTAPGIYLYGLLLEAAISIRSDRLIGLYAPSFVAAVNGLNSGSAQSQWGGSVKTIRSDTGNP